MIRHITLWKLKDFACGNDKEKNFAISRQQSIELAKSYPKIINIEVGRGVKFGGVNFDMCKILDFATREDLEEFLASPIHQHLHAFNAEIRTERAVIDYEVPDPAGAE